MWPLWDRYPADIWVVDCSKEIVNGLMQNGVKQPSSFMFNFFKTSINC